MGADAEQPWWPSKPRDKDFLFGAYGGVGGKPPVQTSARCVPSCGGPVEDDCPKQKVLERILTPEESDPEVKPLFAKEKERRGHDSDQWGDLLPSIPEGQNYLWHTDRGGGKPLFGWRTRYWSFLLKLSKRLPSWTVQAQPGAAIGPFHWNNRKLTFQELCRIQIFPDGLKTESGRTEVQRMLGNAVPSLIAEVLAREIRRQLLDAPIKKPLRLLRPRRTEIPPPVTLTRVPKKYHQHIGHHEAHPGTGKGRRAVKLRDEQLAAE
jgi:hypothetical protein